MATVVSKRSRMFDSSAGVTDFPEWALSLQLTNHRIMLAPPGPRLLLDNQVSPPVCTSIGVLSDAKSFRNEELACEELEPVTFGTRACFRDFLVVQSGHRSRAVSSCC